MWTNKTGNNNNNNPVFFVYNAVTSQTQHFSFEMILKDNSRMKNSDRFILQRKTKLVTQK